MDQVNKKAALLSLVGGILVFIGYYLPWYSIVFAPPGGYTILAGQQVSAFTYAYSGLNTSNTTTYILLHPLTITLLLLGLFDLTALIFAAKTADQVNGFIEFLFKSKGPKTIKDFLQALAHVTVSFLWVAFLFLYLGLGKLAFPGMFADSMGGGTDAIRASHYFSLHFGIGLIFILVGLIASAIAVFQKVAIVAVIFLIVLVFLACTHSPHLAQFLQYLGF